MSSFPILYVAFVGVFLVASAFRYYESFAIASFNSWFYLNGLRCGSATLGSPRPQAPVGARLDTPSGLIKLVEPDLCLIRARPRRLRRRSPVVGAIRWEAGYASLEIRVLMPSVVVWSSWFLAWVSLGASAVPGGLASLGPWVALIIGATPALSFWLIEVPQGRALVLSAARELASEAAG